MDDLSSLNKSQLDFVKEKTRQFLVGWCSTQLTDPRDIEMSDHLPGPPLYLAFAKKAKWVSADGKRVLAVGFKTAAAFLRR